MTETIAPMEKQDNLLDVYMINPDYYFKVTGYVGELFHSVRAWWELSGMKQVLKKEGWIVMPQEYVMVEEGKGVN